MSFQRGNPVLVDSIDQVIQSEHPPYPESGDPRSSNSNVGLNRTPSLPPLASSKRSPRNDNPSNGNPHSHARRSGSRGGSSSGKTMSSVNASTRRSGEGSSSTTVERALGSRTKGQNMADFFSAEVFNIVIHNPTTAHRFLRFCQSRASGENMEFLQKVGGCSISWHSTSWCPKSVPKVGTER